MKKLLFLLLFQFTLIYGQTEKRVISTVDTTQAGELVLKHEFTVRVPLDSVWNTFTTQKGWESAFVAKAEVDFKINGTIKTSYDKNAKIGDSSSISDEKDNVHWFVANTETAFTFDVIMLDLNNKPHDIHNLDIYEKQDLSDGTLRVPILDVENALKKYGKETHH